MSLLCTPVPPTIAPTPLPLPTTGLPRVDGMDGNLVSAFSLSLTGVCVGMMFLWRVRRWQTRRIH